MPCGDEQGRENENVKTKKKLWVQGLYRLRRHGGERVLNTDEVCLIVILFGVTLVLDFTVPIMNPRTEKEKLRFHEKCHFDYTDLHVLHCELRFLNSIF